MKKYLISIILLGYICQAQIIHSPYYYDKTSQFKLIMNNSQPKYMMLGDSITDGGLWNELLNRDDVVNRGISGDVTLGVLNRMDSVQSSVEKAFIMIGINDINREIPMDTIFSNYIEIIKQLQNKNITPIVQSTLYMGISRVQNNKKVTKLNNLLIEYCKENKIEFIDLNKILSPNNLLDKNFTNDDLHLNGNGYLLWSKELSKYFN